MSAGAHEALTYVLPLRRHRAGGTAVFPASSSVLAPMWLLERAVCTWLALGSRVVLGGVPCAGTLLSKSANSRREIRRRLGDRRSRDVALLALTPR